MIRRNFRTKAGIAAPASSTAANDAGYYSNQATMTGLEENTEYVYRVVNGDTVSQTYSFATGEFDGAFSFAFVGDPQIGAASTDTDIEGWDQTLDVIKNNLNPDFMISAGDQVNTASNETQYAGYLNDTLTSLTSATTIGKHDSSSTAYNEHFNLPNESAALGATTAGTDYWFVYNNTLFIDINSNDLSTAEHVEFIKSAIAANPDVKWKTVIFHHSVYSTASHVNDGDIIQRREQLPAEFENLDIDVVLMGHDHVYTRTYMMVEENGSIVPDKTEEVQSSVTNPEGVLYLTANSASGSKYYDIKAPEAEYAAVQDQSYRRTVTDIEVTDTSHTMTTYYADDMSVLDTFTINKLPELDTTELEQLITEAGSLNEADYTADSWSAFQSAYQAAQAILENTEASQADIDSCAGALRDAMNALVKADTEDPEQPGEKPGNPDDSSGTDDEGNGNNNGNGTDNNGTNGNGTSGNKTSTSSGNKVNTPKTGDTVNTVAAVLILAAAGTMIFILGRKKIRL